MVTGGGFWIEEEGSETPTVSNKKRKEEKRQGNPLGLRCPLDGTLPLEKNPSGLSMDNLVKEIDSKLISQLTYSLLAAELYSFSL